MLRLQILLSHNKEVIKLTMTKLMFKRRRFQESFQTLDLDFSNNQTQENITSLILAKVPIFTRIHTRQNQDPIDIQGNKINKNQENNKPKYNHSMKKTKDRNGIIMYPEWRKMILQMNKPELCMSITIGVWTSGKYTIGLLRTLNT